MFEGLQFKAETWPEMFSDIREKILVAPQVRSRVALTKELINPVLVLENPQSRLFYQADRKFNLIYAIVEGFMILNGSNELKNFEYFNSKMADFSDDGETLNSAYGQYVAPNIMKIVDMLKSDPDSRQAVVSIYKNKFVGMKSKDIPCTLNLHFLIREGKLNLTVYMRSNDLIWGLQYDLFAFTMLQEMVANELGIGIGKYIHCPTSLHVYDYHWELLEKMEKQTIVDVGTCEVGCGVSEGIFISSAIHACTHMHPDYLTNIQNTSPMIVEVLNQNTMFNLIHNEFMYKENGTILTLPESLDWCEPFTKRWYK